MSFIQEITRNIKGEYRNDGILTDGRTDHERLVDARRRLNDNLQFIVGKRILDFGCGAGDFLKRANKYALSAEGVELQADCSRS